MRLLLFLAVLLASCAGGPLPAPTRPLRDFRGIIHCHSKYSHDSRGSYEEILAAAKAAKIDFVCMTDHPPKDDPGLPLREGWRGMRDGVLFIQGAEYGDNLLALGLKEPVTAKGRPARIDAIHAQGGLAFVCHPEEVKDWDAFAGADGREISSVHAALKAARKDPAFLPRVMKMLKEDPERSYTLLQELDPAILKKWDELNRERRFVGIAGNDAHQNVDFFGMRMDPYPRAFKFVTTHVLAGELTEASILRALQQGRAYVRFELFPPQDPQMAGLSWIGEEAPGPIDAGVQDSSARWVYDGKPLRHHRLEKPGAYRLEYQTFSRDPAVGEPWILTNHVRVR